MQRRLTRVLALTLALGCERVQLVGGDLPHDSGPDAPICPVQPPTAGTPCGAAIACSYPHWCCKGPMGVQTALCDGVWSLPEPDCTACEEQALASSRGFVVHEWGTNTVVVGSDGKLLRGMHHEEEDLPAFVYDRLAQGQSLPYPSVDKMETPVDYFYSDVPRTVRVSVGMPNGLLTQWYPGVEQFAPSIVEGANGKVDPHLDVRFAFDSQRCREKYGGIAGGRLDWGSVEILAPDASARLPDAPLERFTWSYARDVAANPLRVRGQDERFLFYRGLGNFTLPVEVRETEQGVTLRNQSEWSTQGPVFVLDVGTDSASFQVGEGALAPSSERTIAWPTTTLPIDAFMDALEAALTTALQDTGLYQDEAVAMVRTWRRQWFRTPGVRVLHLAPEAWIDREVPLAISPAPDVLLRVMVLRVELLKRSTEAEDRRVAEALDLGPSHAAAEQYFRALGRFAEPRLRRALETSGSLSPAAATFLAAIEHPNSTGAFGP